MGARVVCDRAFCKKAGKARSKLRGRGSCATVPFAKKRERHGRKAGARIVRDRAFYKKASKARSKSGGEDRVRPCLLQKSVKGTVEKCAQMGCVTVPFVKKRQRHGRKVGARVERDRAFCKKTSKARSKSGGGCRARPCLLQKSVKGTVEKWGRGSCATVPFTKNVKGTVRKCGRGSCVTVPFAKKRQRHGRKVGAGVERDRAFCKKASKARSKLWGRRHARPCLLQKNVKGTVEKRRRGSCATVPFAKKRQRHGRKAGARVERDRAFCKKTSKARSKSAPRRFARPCLLQKNVKGTVGKVPARWPASFYKEAAFGGSL